MNDDAANIPLSRAAFLASIAGVIVAHAMIELLLYSHPIRVGVFTDELTLLGPAIVAFAVYYLLLRARWPTRRLGAGAMALFLAISSFWLSLLLPFNIYGS